MQHSSSSRSGRCLTRCLACLVVLLISAPVCRAQWSYSCERPWRSTVQPNDIALLVEMAELTTDQQTIVEAMHREYMIEFQAFVEEGKELEAKLQKEWDKETPGSIGYHKAMLDFRERMTPYAKKQAKLNRDFAESLRTVLREDQIRGYTRWRYALNRHYLHPTGHRYPEEQADLIAVLKDLDLEEDEIVPGSPLEVLRHEYEAKLDDRLRERYEFYVTHFREHWRYVKKHTVYDTERDMAYFNPPSAEQDERLERQCRRQQEIHQGIRDLTRKYAGEFRECILSDRRQVEFDRLFLESCAPNFFSKRRARARTLAHEIMNHDDTPAAVSAAIESNFTQYESAVIGLAGVHRGAEQDG